VAVSDWESMRWGYDKRLTYQVAQDLGIDCPATLYPNNREELGAFAGEFPVILKPAFKRRPNDFTRDKAWLARDRDELLRRYDDAIKLVDPSAVVVQEVISGGGETQFSYAGLFEAGIPLASVAVRRSRQYPVDFGTGTLVETIESGDMEQTAERLLRHIKYSGVAEIEFKRDPRNGTYKLLDFNPRIWRWHSLAGAAGVDLPYLLWRWMLNEPIAKARARAGVQWVYMRNDIRAVAVEIGRGRLSAPHYLRSLLQISTFAVLAKDDLFPALIDLPLMFFHQAADWWNGLSKVLRPVFRRRRPTPSK